MPQCTTLHYTVLAPELKRRRFTQDIVHGGDLQKEVEVETTSNFLPTSLPPTCEQKEKQGADQEKQEANQEKQGTHQEE